ncbi:MAG: MFS transporter [Sulfobacillus sp.]|nr:MFS transporter [Sulfobacillus sp.]
MRESFAAPSQAASSGRTGWALAVIVLGVLITAVDTTIVILALPTMVKSLHASLTGVVWVIMAYLLVITVLATQVGRLGDMFGRVRMYEVGFLIFVIGSFLCGISTVESELIGFRILQGIGGALVTANSGAVIADTFSPEHRGRAYGFTSIGWNVGAILGILLGGFITTYWSWREIFLINVPIGLVAMVIAVLVLRDRGERVRQPLDWWGMLFLSGGLLLILLALVHLAAHSLTTRLAGELLLGLVFLGVFIMVERRQSSPMLHLELFRVRMVSASFVAAFFQAVGNFSVLFLIMMYLQGVRQLTPMAAALLMVPGYLAGGLLGPVTGRLADRFGPAGPASAGLMIQAVALFLYAHLGISSPLWRVTAISIVNGIGNAGFFPANNAAVMKGAPRGAYGIASGMLRTFANVGMVLSFATAMVVAATEIPRRLAFAIFVGTGGLSPLLRTSFTQGMHAAFYLAIGLMMVAGIFSLLWGPQSA